MNKSASDKTQWLQLTVRHVWTDFLKNSEHQLCGHVDRNFKRWSLVGQLIKRTSEHDFKKEEVESELVISNKTVKVEFCQYYSFGCFHQNFVNSECFKTSTSHPLQNHFLVSAEKMFAAFRDLWSVKLCAQENPCDAWVLFL